MNTPESACIGKHRFDDRRIAAQVSKKFGQRKHGAHSLYRCAHCGGWHIGNRLPGAKGGK